VRHGSQRARNTLEENTEVNHTAGWRYSRLAVSGCSKEDGEDRLAFVL
jgi:hypothetical protein